MSQSIVMIPDELKTDLDVNHQAYKAEYTFTPTNFQKQTFRKLYKASINNPVQIQLQFFQSSNQLAGSDPEDENLIRLKYQEHGDFIYEDFAMGGTFYSIAEFMDWLMLQINNFLSKLPTPQTSPYPLTEFDYDENILQNEGLFNLRLKSAGEDVPFWVQFYGYNLIQMLGLNLGKGIQIDPISGEEVFFVEWSFSELIPPVDPEDPEEIPLYKPVIGTEITAVKHYFMPVVKQMAFESDLQSLQNVYYDEYDKIHRLLGIYISSLQQGDAGKISTNIPIDQIDIDKILEGFYVRVLDQNWMICKWLDEFKITFTFQTGTVDLSKILTNKTQ